MSDDPIKTDQEDVILSVKLPVRCSVLGLLATTLADEYGLGILMHKVGDHLEFFLPPGYEPPDRDDEGEE